MENVAERLWLWSWSYLNLVVEKPKIYVVSPGYDFRGKKRRSIFCELTLLSGDRVLNKLEAELTVWGL